MRAREHHLGKAEDVGKLPLEAEGVGKRPLEPEGVGKRLPWEQRTRESVRFVSEGAGKWLF